MSAKFRLLRVRSSPNSHYAAATLPGLPPELILEIFESVDSFATALALVKTCHRIQSVWKTNAQKILPYVVECYPQAQELVQAQGNVRFELRWFPWPGAFTTASRCIWKNAEFASRLLKRYEKRVISDTASREIKRGGLSPKERADFLRGVYRVMTFAVTGRRAVPFSFLEPLDMLDYMQMKEVMDVVYHCFHTEPEKTEICNMFPRFLDAVRRTWLDLTMIEIDLMNLPFDLDGFLLRRNAPFNYFLADDGYQAKAGSARGPRLADLLPLIAKNGYCARRLPM